MKTLAVYGQGINFMGQLGLQNGYTNSPHFTRVPSLDGVRLRQLEAHFSQSFVLLEDSQILHWGWVLDSLTTIRTLNFYKNNPKLCQFWQKYSCFGSTLGMRSGSDRPTLISRQLMQVENIKKIAVGGSFVLALTKNGDVYATGDNYKGQLGLNDLTYRSGFDKVVLPTKEKIVDIKGGLQFLQIYFVFESGRVYGSGRTNNSQYLSSDNHIVVDHNSQLKLQPFSNKITQISAGFHHSLFLTIEQKLYACGLNNYGQCGLFEMGEPFVRSFIEIPLGLEMDENIKQLESGKSHNLLLTSKGRLMFFGATLHGQLGRKISYDFEQIGPTEVDLPLEQGEYITKIKAGFNSCAAFTSTGDCFIWGGEDLSKYGIQYYPTPTRIRNIFGKAMAEVQNIAFGYMHTLIQVIE